MRTILNRCIISAVVLTNFFLAASTPIPLTGSGLLSVKPSNGDSTTASRFLQLAVDGDNELGLLARDPTDDEDNTGDTTTKLSPMPDPITIPHVFRPAGTASAPELKMTSPRPTDHNIWASVLNILHLIDAAVEKNPTLYGSGETFANELKKMVQGTHNGSLHELAQKLKKFRTNAFDIPETNTEGMNLETILKHIESAVEKHNEFQGDIKIPKAFSPGETLGMKIPYPNNAQAVSSVIVIIGLLRSATGKDTKQLDDQLSGFRNNLRLRFGVNTPTFERSSLRTRLTEAKFKCCHELIRTALARHNNNDWLKEGDIVVPEFPEDGKAYEPPTKPSKERSSVQIPKTFFLPSTDKKTLHLNLPTKDDKEGMASLNHILELMALVGGPGAGKSWETFQENLETHGLLVITNPKAFGPLGEEGANVRKQAVVDAVHAHNKVQVEKNEQAKQSLKPGGTRPGGTTPTSLGAQHEPPFLQPSRQANQGTAMFDPVKASSRTDYDVVRNQYHT
ncbi:hypothetical protein H0H93_014575 [Arthromyces matolae]|nr:hypothetical protein H0H93_014575 [Arthromyces matolae]